MHIALIFTQPFTFQLFSALKKIKDIIGQGDNNNNTLRMTISCISCSHHTSKTS